MDKAQFKELLSKDGVSSPTLDQYVDFLFVMGEPENLGALDVVLDVVARVDPTTKDLQRFVMGERGWFPDDLLIRHWMNKSRPSRCHPAAEKFDLPWFGRCLAAQKTGYSAGL
jgi:hypothetical protein